MSKIGRMIKFHRKKAKLSQEVLAKLSGIGKTSVFDIEKGKETVKIETLMAVLRALNIQIKFEGPLMHKFEENEKS